MSASRSDEASVATPMAQSFDRGAPLNEHELEQMRSRLHRERASYANLLESVPIACIATGIGGGIREANRRAAELLGVPLAFLVDRPMIAFVARADTRIFRGAVRAAAPIEGLTLRVRPRRRPVVLVVVSAVPIFDARRRVAGMRWFLRPDGA